MKSVKKIILFCGYIILGLIGLHLLGHEAFAADNKDGWRPVFDLVMRWLNFAILAFLLTKFSRTPIKNFFQSRKEELTKQIETLENEKNEALEKVNENLKLLEQSGVRFETLKERIIARGQKNKQKIIEDAHQESKILLESAKHKIENQIVEARDALKVELIDSAIALAMQRLPKKITAEDNQKWVDNFLKSASAK
jgi:F-type H+-transporting ATPase subunit b